MDALEGRRCKVCEGGVAPLDEAAARALLAQVDQWTFTDEGRAIERTFTFKNYYRTVAFVNAVAWIAHQEDHHPDISFGYKQCRVRYATHSIGGLSENDFICAAKIDRLLAHAD
ncbi:4a-hydroxytetrahydrobiopterin dehydratase [Ectothiorhodospiraceae bacterium 2226]|nr:4a-hydroxytetrahydrobiopterin dehydratase [Ectothiorhodospiraceae bacterium 2226]